MASDRHSAVDRGICVYCVLRCVCNPKGRIYTRRAIPQNRQSSWKDAMYYIPFPTEEANKMKNFVNNEIW